MDLIVNGELVLYGSVGSDWFDDFFTARDVVSSLAQLKGKDINVRINSGGGIADEGVAIYNSLKNHTGTVTVYVDGIAASAASVIAMAGSKIVMRTGSVMMVHDPLMLAIGNADDMRKAIEALDAVGDAMADIYSAKTGRPAEAVRKEMRDELWMTAAEAKAKGYADDEDDSEAIEASAFDYRAYSRAPERIVELSDERTWSNRLRKVKAAAEPQPKGTQPMADTVTKEAAAAMAEAQAKDAADKATTEATERAAQIVEACVKAEAPAMAASMIRSGSSLADVTARIEGAKEIRADVAKARKACPTLDANLADQYIAAGKTIEAVRADLFERMSAVQAAKPTRSQHQASTGADDNEKSLWAKQVDKVNARAGL